MCGGGDSCCSYMEGALCYGDLLNNRWEAGGENPTVSRPRSRTPNRRRARRSTRSSRGANRDACALRAVYVHSLRQVPRKLGNASELLREPGPSPGRGSRVGLPAMPAGCGLVAVGVMPPAGGQEKACDRRVGRHSRVHRPGEASVLDHSAQGDANKALWAIRIEAGILSR